MCTGHISATVPRTNHTGTQRQGMVKIEIENMHWKLPGMAVMCCGKFRGISNSITLTLKKQIQQNTIVKNDCEN